MGGATTDRPAPTVKDDAVSALPCKTTLEPTVKLPWARKFPASLLDAAIETLI